LLLCEKYAWIVYVFRKPDRVQICYFNIQNAHLGIEAMYYNKVRSINVRPSSSERYTGHGMGHSTQVSEVYSLRQQLYFQKPSISTSFSAKEDPS
jgi:hypothetical protein